MPVKFRGRARGELKEFAPAYFKVFPAAFVGETNEPISYQIHRFPIKDKGFACVAKWEANATPACKQTAHFHQRN